MLLHWLKSLFLDELLVFIHPQHVVFIRLSRSIKHGLKQQLTHSQVIDLPKNIEEVDGIECLETWLRQEMAQRIWQGAIPTVIVSNALTRYTVIPWDAGLAVTSERQAYLKHYFNLAYGEVTKKWHLQMSEPMFGQAAIASGISLDLLQAVHSVFAEVGIKRIAVYPQLMLTINQAFTQIKKNDQIRTKDNALTFWLVAIQGGRVCLTLLENGGWRTAKNVAIEHDLSVQVSSLIQREILHCNVNVEVPMLVYWPASSADQPLALQYHTTIKVMPHVFDRLNHQVASRLPSWACV